MIQDLPVFKFILYNGVETWELPQSPDGWEESFIEWERSVIDFGIIRNYSIPLKWTLDGAFFLRNSFYRKGIQAFTSLIIKKLVPADLTYINYYSGTIDYSSLVDNYVTVEANIMDSGMASLIRAFGDTLYDIDLDNDPESVDISFRGIELIEKAVMITKGNGTIAARFNYLGADIVTLPESKLTPPVRNSGAAANSNTETIPANDAWFFQAPTGQFVRFVGTINLHVVPGFPGNSWSIDFVTANNIGIVSVQNIGTFDVIANAPAYDLAFPIDEEIFVGPLNKLWIRITASIGTGTGITNIPSSFTLEYRNKAAESFHKGLRADKVFDRLIQKISGLSGQTQSFLLSSNFPNLYYTSGDALRDISGSKLKIALNDFVRDWKGIACAGLGVENEMAVLERRDYFFRRTQKIDSIGPVQNVSFDVPHDLVYNSINVGSKDENINDINGRFEFNSEVQWVTPITKITQEYNILTASRTDAYGIEFTRIDFLNKNTTDTKADNEAFIVDVHEVFGVGFFAAIRQERYSFASGSPAIETVYNLFLSPKQNLLRHNYWLASSMNGVENFFISPVSFKKNDGLITTDFGGNTVIENSSIFIQDLGEKLYFPIVATVTAKYAKSLFTVINNTPYGYMEFTWQDNIYRGYLLSASFNPANYEEKEFKLLLTPDNNLLSLIR